MSNANQALQLINQAVISLGSKAAVATKMGVSRTAVSLVLAGKYCNGQVKQDSYLGSLS